MAHGKLDELKLRMGPVLIISLSVTGFMVYPRVCILLRRVWFDENLLLIMSSRTYVRKTSSEI
jgi:hypothetical protein